MSDSNQHIRDALSEYQDHYSTDNEERKEDLRFMSLQQYDKIDSNEIQLVFDRCNRVRNRIVNPCRVHPFGFGVASGYGMPAEKAIKLNALFDRIQEESSAYSCYTDAFDLALACGQGFLIIGTDYSQGDGLDQKLVVSFAKDPTSVYLDPSSEAIDGSDSENACHVSSMGLALSSRLYGIKKDVHSSWSILPENWDMPNNSVPVVTYWSRKGIKKEVLYFQTESGVIGMTIEQIKGSQFPIDVFEKFRSGKTFTHKNKEVVAVTEYGAIKSLEWRHHNPIEVNRITQKQAVGKPFAYESNDIGDT